MERYRSGHNGADSKSVWEQSHAGSNPALSAIIKDINCYSDFEYKNCIYEEETPIYYG